MQLQNVIFKCLISGQICTYKGQSGRE